MTYIAQNISIEELAYFGCDVFSEIKRQKVEYNAYDDDDAMQSLLEDRDIDYIRHFH
ncbi:MULTISPECIES: hypothetical protein [Brucella/Ochrobactrum group]|uniref:hypothetical protein n=1 Tax=Brucella/Ochrobactrum group TaxID=2826938 RepID=UPI0015D6356F|nr:MULTISPECIES: hypothetical protein [Brucella/Ochrobactrum group]